MSDTHRKHAPMGVLKKRGGQPKVRSAQMLILAERSGGGVHYKPHKQRRVNERATLRKEWL